jgi:hypothetical protein
MDGGEEAEKEARFERKKDAQEYEREFLAKTQRSPDMSFASLVALYNDDMRGGSAKRRASQKNG